jgi:predicted transcriptional regulator
MGGIYTAPLTKAIQFFEMTANRRQQEYQALLQQLSCIGWISEGYAQDRGRGAGGPCFQWTRKVKGKTVSVALSEEQFDAMTKAIENWQKTKKIIKRMQQLSREEIFTTLPGTKRKKPLSKKVLGLI